MKVDANTRPPTTQLAAKIARGVTDIAYDDITPSDRKLTTLYARWREMTDERLPRGYHGNDTLADGWVCSDVAKSICAALPTNRKHPIRRLLDQFVDVQWPSPLDAAEYSKYGALRIWLERVGIGLGVFDLIITDEAHKSRGTENGLSRLLERYSAIALR